MIHKVIIPITLLCSTSLYTNTKKITEFKETPKRGEVIYYQESYEGMIDFIEAYPTIPTRDIDVEGVEVEADRDEERPPTNCLPILENIATTFAQVATKLLVLIFRLMG